MNRGIMQITSMFVCVLLMISFVGYLQLYSSSIDRSPRVSIDDLLSMDKDKPIDYLFKTYVAGRIVRVYARDLPFLWGRDPRYVYILVYSDGELISVPVRIYREAIEFNRDTVYNGTYYAIPKVIDRDTVIEFKLPSKNISSSLSISMDRIPKYLRGATLYPVDLVVKLENGRDIPIRILVAYAKIRNVEIIKNSVDYSAYVEDFELYGVKGFYKRVLELAKQGIVEKPLRLVREYSNHRIDAYVVGMENAIPIPDGSTQEWNVLELVPPWKEWSIVCKSMPCTRYTRFRYIAHRNAYPNVSTIFLAYLIEVAKISEDPPNNTRTHSTTTSTVSSTKTKSSTHTSTKTSRSTSRTQTMKTTPTSSTSSSSSSSTSAKRSTSTLYKTTHSSTTKRDIHTTQRTTKVSTYTSAYTKTTAQRSTAITSSTTSTSTTYSKTYTVPTPPTITTSPIRTRTSTSTRVITTSSPRPIPTTNK